MVALNSVIVPFVNRGEFIYLFIFGILNRKRTFKLMAGRPTPSNAKAIPGFSSSSSFVVRLGFSHAVNGSVIYHSESCLARAADPTNTTLLIYSQIPVEFN